MSEAKFIDLPIDHWLNHDMADASAYEQTTIRVMADSGDHFFLEHPSIEGYWAISRLDLIEALRQSIEGV